MSGETGFETAFFRDVLEWRAWLEQNHASAKEVWLVHPKKSGAGSGLGMAEAVGEAIRFGWIDSKLKSIDGKRYALRYSPRRPDSVWSMTNRRRAESLMESGQMTPAGMATVEEARRRGLWDAAYTDREEVPVPDDLQVALQRHDLARGNFARFPVSHRNMYVRWVADARTEATRRKRIAEVVARSASNRRPGTG